VEVFKAGKKWQVQRGSPFGRRVTGNTKMRIAGPAAGNAAMKAKSYEITPTGSVDTSTTTDGFTANVRSTMRARLHALGHLPRLRGELERVFRVPHSRPGRLVRR